MEFESKLECKVVSGQAREVIANVILFMQREAIANGPIKKYKKVQERAALAIGVSLATIKRISREMKNIEEGASTPLSTPNTKRIKKAPKSNSYELDRDLLLRIVINFYTQEKRVPTVKHITRKLTEECDYNGSRETVRKVMKEMGFRWRKTRNKRKILMEKPDIQVLRKNFLREYWNTTDVSKRFGTYAFRLPKDDKEGIWVSFEDPDTVTSKASYVKAKGLGGVAIVDLTLDDFRGLCTGDKYPILRAAKFGL